MKSKAHREAPLALALPFCGILAAYVVLQAFQTTPPTPLRSLVFALLTLFVFSACGMLLAIIDIRSQRHADGLAIAAIFANGFFLLPLLLRFVHSLLFYGT